MYTGIVTHRGLIEAVEKKPGQDGMTSFRIRPEAPLEGLAIGESVAVDGVCLTITFLGEGALSFDAIPETLRKTTLGERRVGDRVNLECPLRMGDALGGHWVQGHVDGTGRIASVEQQGDDVRLVVAVDEPLYAGVIPKGSVTVDGCSLTVGEVWPDEAGGGSFSLYLIPHTLAVTGFGRTAVGDRVNVELDVLGRWVEHHLRRARPDALSRDEVRGTGPGPR